VSFKFPEKALLEASHEQNPDGIGIAYWTDKGIVFKKGIKFEQLMEYEKKIPEGTAMIIHFRRATVGAGVPELCHPFPVTTKEALNHTEGIADVVFAHNGGIGEWRNYITAALSSKNPLPSGDHWSDTKAIAFVLGTYGVNYLNIIDDGKQKYATLDKEGRIKRWGTFTEVEKDKIYTSQNITPKRNYAQQQQQQNHSPKWNQGNTQNGYNTSDEDKVIAVPVDNPNAHALVVISRGASVETREDNKPAVTTTMQNQVQGPVGPVPASSPITPCMRSNPGTKPGRFSPIDIDTPMV